MASHSIVSVLIPLYNQKRYFKACISSVCNQTYRDLEIIIVNDGSTDGSAEIAKEWAGKDNRILLMDKPNEGVTAARRDGLKRATGEYIAFVDSDDLLPSRAIEVLVGCMEGTEVDLAVGAVTKQLGFIKRHDVDRFHSFPYHQVIGQPELFDRYFVGFYRNSVFPVSMWGRLYRKSAIDKAMRETELFDKDVKHMGEDQFFNLKLFPYLRAMYRTDETVYIYRYGGGTTRFNPHFPQLFVSSDKRLALLDQYHYTPGYKPLYDEYVACLYFYASQLIYDKRGGKEDVIDYFKKELTGREVAGRMVEYYTQNNPGTKPVSLILDQDYEEMYQYASEQGNQLFGSVTFKMKTMMLRLIERLF